MDNNEKVQIKLERHKWPDELEREKKKRKSIALISIALLTAFVFGWQANKLVLGDNSFVQTSSDTSKFDRVYRDVINNWYFGKDMEDVKSELQDNAIKGMLEQNGDPHTSYMTKEESQSFSQSINMSFVGIGVQYYAGGDLNVITNVFKDSPAEKAGLQAGDIIQRVDGVTITEDNSIQELVLGEAGTKVKIDILRGEQVLNLELTRAQVSALASGYMANKDTAYLAISSFGEQLGAVTKNYLDGFKQEGAKNLILDLRDNGGGLLDAVNDLSKLFLKNGDIVYQENYTNGKTDVYKVTGSIADQYPLDSIVILINENSASASEVLTLALVGNVDAKVVGTTSYGKGTVQVSYSYPDRSALKVTIAKWMGPDGTSIDKTGIKPDYEVKLADIFYTSYVELEEGFVINPDSVHEAVAYVQKGLKYLGVHNGRTDGYYDTITQTSLNDFAAKFKLDAIQNIDKNVVSKVYSFVLRDWALNKKDMDIQLHKAIEVIYE